MGWLAVIGGIIQVVLLLIQSHTAKESEVKQNHADNAKAISDAIASGDISKLNAVIQQLRK